MNEARIEERDRDAIATIHRIGARWPVERNRVQRFSQDDLSRVRLHNSEVCPHTEVSIPVTSSNRRGRLTCALCVAGVATKRATTKMCSVCQVPLCTTNQGDELSSHFTMWHNCNDLMEAHELCKSGLIQLREASRARRDALDTTGNAAGNAVDTAENDNAGAEDDVDDIAANVDDDNDAEGGADDGDEIDEFAEMVVPMLDHDSADDDVNTPARACLNNFAENLDPEIFGFDEDDSDVRMEDITENIDRYNSAHNFKEV